MPSAKHAFSLLSLRFSNGRTAIDLSSLRAEARGKINKPATKEISTPAPSKMRRLRRPRRCGEAKLDGGVARIPCGVTSKAHASISPMGKPVSNNMTTRRSDQFGNSHAGKTAEES